MYNLLLGCPLAALYVDLTNRVKKCGRAFAASGVWCPAGSQRLAASKNARGLGAVTDQW